MEIIDTQVKKEDTVNCLRRSLFIKTISDKTGIVFIDPALTTFNDNPEHRDSNLVQGSVLNDVWNVATQMKNGTIGFAETVSGSLKANFVCVSEYLMENPSSVGHDKILNRNKILMDMVNTGSRVLVFQGLDKHNNFNKYCYQSVGAVED